LSWQNLHGINSVNMMEDSAIPPSILISAILTLFQLVAGQSVPRIPKNSSLERYESCFISYQDNLYISGNSSSPQY
jgi:hypothetical protein